MSTILHQAAERSTPRSDAFAPHRRFSSKKTALLAAIMVLLPLLPGEAGARVYVSVTGSDTNNGTSWADAYRTLEAAIGGTIATEEFWIAGGTYTPSETLVLGDKQNHSYYGGFAGNETSLDQRDPAAHPTIIDGRGVLKHVFNVTSFVSSVRFDGLTIRGGAATAASGPDRFGGAVVVNKAAVVIADCTFTANTAFALGGAVYLLNNASVLVTDSVFTGNRATSDTEGGGGALSVTWSLALPAPDAVIRGCRFQENSSRLEGGAVYSHSFPVIIEDSTFLQNDAANGGAVMLDFDTGKAATIRRCRFFGNSGGQGGAVCTFERTVSIINSVFSANWATWGGAVRLHGGSVPGYTGAVASSTFHGNTATEGGGALRSINVAMLDVSNSILWGNTAGYFQSGSNCIHNLTVDLSNLATSVTIRHTDMESLDWCHGSDTEVHAGSFAADPFFVDPDGSDNVPGTADDNLSIADASPCTDSADGDLAPAADLVLRPRVDNPAVRDEGVGTPPYADIGAFEGPYQPPQPPPFPGPPGVFRIAPILSLLLGSARN